MGQVVSEKLQSAQFSRRCGLSSGQPIGRLMAQALKYPGLVSLAAGFVDNATLPTEATAKALRSIADNPSLLLKSLQYDTSPGNEVFRDNLAQWSYRKWPNCEVKSDRVILTAGSNQLLHLVADAVLDPGDIVLAAAPTYFVFIGTLKGVDARVVGVHADEDGICMDSLEEQLQRIASEGNAHRVKAIYSVTEFDNPAGSTLSLERRQRLLEIVRRWRKEHGPLVVISDNAYQHLRYSGEELPPLLTLADDAHDFVIEAGTFSKSYSPGIRVGWGVVPKELMLRLLEMKSNMDFGSPHFSQVLMNEVLTTGALDEHLPVIAAGYKAKLTAMLNALDSELGQTPGVSWRKPNGGLYVWLTLPEHINASDSAQLWSISTDRGVIYVPGHYCFPSEGVPTEMNTIRLSFGVQSSDGIREGIKRLAHAIGEVS